MKELKFGRAGTHSGRAEPSSSCRPTSKDSIDEQNSPTEGDIRDWKPYR